MLDASVARPFPAQFGLTYDELHPAGHQVWKTVTIHEFPDGVEVFFDEAHETYSDGAALDAIELAEKAERGEGDRERSIERSSRRAKTKVRRLCKAMQADCMMTLTYRANVQDKKRVLADFKAFRKRLEALGEFHYVATVEKQQRGALHVHIACQQFPAYLRNEQGVRVRSYQLISSMWSRVIGRGNGNVNFTKPRGRNSAHRIASYIAKYVAKTVTDAELNAKSYFASRGIVMPKPVRFYFDANACSWDIVALIAQEFALRGYTDVVQFADRTNQFYWFAASSPA